MKEIEYGPHKDTVALSAISLLPWTRSHPSFLKKAVKKYRMPLQLVPFPNLWNLRNYLGQNDVVAYEKAWSPDPLRERIRKYGMKPKQMDPACLVANDWLFGNPQHHDLYLQNLIQQFPNAIEIDTGRPGSICEISRYTNFYKLGDTEVCLDSWHLREQLVQGHALKADLEEFEKFLEELLGKHLVRIIHLQTRSKKEFLEFISKGVNSTLGRFLLINFHANPHVPCVVENHPLFPRGDTLRKARDLVQLIRTFAS